MGTRKLRKDSRASRVLVEIDHAWWYYYTDEPLPWEERPHGWPFCIKSLIKYFPGCYEEAEKAAKRAAKVPAYTGTTLSKKRRER